MENIIQYLDLTAVIIAWLVSVGIPTGGAIWAFLKQKKYAQAFALVVEAVESKEAQGVKETVAELSKEKPIGSFVSSEVAKLTPKKENA